jgi:hypothetical protein
MRANARLSLAILTAFAAFAGMARADSKAPPTFVNVERSIEAARKAEAGAERVLPGVTGANSTFLDDLLADLKSCSKAGSSAERLAALEKIEQRANALAAGAAFPPAALQLDLERWLVPRLRASRAMRAISDLAAETTAPTDASAEADRSRWREFIDEKLGQTLRAYDAAETVANRQAALDRIHTALEALNRNNQIHSWAPAWELQSALNELLNQPNVHVRADLATVRPYFERNLITDGPIRRKQYVSQLTGGPKTGFGLLTSNDGIAFFNSQRYRSVTPVWDFHDNLEADEQGQRVARMYHFFCTTYDWAEVTVTTLLTTEGISLSPCYHHTIDAKITSEPVCDHHARVLRTLASAAGFDQQAINDRVYKESVERFKERIPIEAQEQGEEMTSQQAAERTAALREQYLVGDNSVALGARILISKVVLGSRPEGVFANGVFQWRGAARARGANMPVPAQLPRPETGASAAIHPASMLTNLASGLLETGDWRTVENVMIIVKPIPPGAPPREGLEVTRNVDFATYAKTVEDIRTGRRPKGTALRITRPSRPPEFSADDRGFLVGFLHDLQLDVPAPSLEARGVIGPPAKIYRIKMPNVELVASYQFDLPSPGSLRMRLKVEDFLPGAGAEVLAIGDDITKTPSLSRFSTGIVIGALGARLRNRPPFEIFPDQSPLRGFTVQSVTPPDPSGWARVNLVRAAEAVEEAPAPSSR